MLREVGVQEGVVGIEDVQDRAVALEEVGEKPDRLLIHRAARSGEGGEVAFALLAQFVEVVDVQPGAGEFGRQPACAVVLHHAAHLRGEHVGLPQLAAGGDGAQFDIRRGRPEKIAQARGELPIVHRPRLVTRPRLLGAIKKRRSHEHARECKADRFVMRKLLRSQLEIQAAQFRLLRFSERAAIRAVGELQHGVEVLRLRIHEQLLEFLGALPDRFAHRRERARVGVLRGELPELLEGIDELERIMADVVQFRPEPVDLGGLSLVEHQPAERVILTVVKRERHHLIDRHNLRVAKRGREQLSKVVEVSLDAFSRGAAVRHEDGRVGNHGPFAVGPGAFAALFLDRPRRQTDGGGLRQ